MTSHRAREAEIGELLARVEAATGPMSTREIEQCIRLSPWYADDALTKDPLFWNDFCRALQGSVEAALSFVEWVLPIGPMVSHELRHSLARDGEELWNFRIKVYSDDEGEPPTVHLGTAWTAPLAILGALLSALSSPTLNSEDK